MSLKTTLATLKGYFTGGAANNALKLGGAALSAMVQTSGDQNISGVKNFTGTLQSGGAQVAGISLSTSSTETAYPVGSILLWNSSYAVVNQAVTPYTGGTTGSIISGTWRSRGSTYDSLNSCYRYLIQRVA